MFCPNCASNNDEDVKFCRGCGQSLSLVARSLKEHSPVVLICKVDKLFDRQDEHLLRNGIFWLAGGLISFIFQLLQFSFYGWDKNGLLVFLISLFCFSFGSWNLLLYKHSFSTAKRKPSTISPTVIYCPACGEPNETELDFCRQCAKELAIVREIISFNRRGWLTGFLDRNFGWLAQDINKSTQAYLDKGNSFITPLAIGTFLILQTLINSFQNPFLLIIGLLIGIICIILSYWNYVTAQRSGFEEPQMPLTLTNVLFTLKPSSKRRGIIFDYFPDVILFITKNYKTTLKALLVLTLISAFILSFLVGLNSKILISFLGLGFVIYFAFVFLIAIQLMVLMIFPSSYILILREQKDDQIIKKKKVMGITTLLVFFILPVFSWFFVGNLYFFSFFAIVAVTLIVRLLQFMMVVFGLVERNLEYIHSEAEIVKLERHLQYQNALREFWADEESKNDLIGLNLLEQNRQETKKLHAETQISEIENIEAETKKIIEEG